MNPCWRDVRGLDPRVAIEEMYRETGCLEYYCNVADYASWGWLEDGRRISVDNSGARFYVNHSYLQIIATVTPSKFCPRGLIWPAPEENVTKKLENDLEHARQSIRDEQDHRVAAESKIAAYVNAFEAIYAAMRGIK